MMVELDTNRFCTFDDAPFIQLLLHTINSRSGGISGGGPFSGGVSTLTLNNESVFG